MSGNGFAFSSGCSRATAASNSGSGTSSGSRRTAHERGTAVEPDRAKRIGVRQQISARLGSAVSRAKSSSEVNGRRSRAATMRSAQSSTLPARNSRMRR